jgi:hypothetical protein
MNKKRIVATVLLTSAITVAVSPEAKAGEGWDVSVTPYMWAAGIDGQIDIGTQSSNISYDFSDIIKDLNLAAEVMLEVNRDRWVNWAVFDYFSLENGDVNVGPLNANLESDMLLFAVGSGYRFDTSDRSTLDVLLGVRYLGMDNKLKISGVGNVHGNNDVYDAILTLRPRLRLSDRWTLSPTLSIGTGDSDYVLGMSPQLLYTISDRLDARFGYRRLSYNFKDGSDEVDITLAGLYFGLGIKF